LNRLAKCANVRICFVAKQTTIPNIKDQYNGWTSKRQDQGCCRAYEVGDRQQQKQANTPEQLYVQASCHTVRWADDLHT